MHIIQGLGSKEGDMFTHTHYLLAIPCVLILFVVCCYEVELESAMAELEESNSKVTKLRAEHDAAKRAGFPVLNLGGKQSGSGKVRDKQKDLRDMESSLKDLKVLVYPPPNPHTHI